MDNVIYGKDVANKVATEIEELKRTLKDSNVTTAIVRVGNNPDDIAYESSIIKKFQALNINTEKITFDENISHSQFRKEIESLNSNNKITGMLVLRPLPSQINSDIISQVISSEKDLDGMSHTNIARLFANDSTGFIPCTPQAVIETLDYAKVDLVGKDICIVGAGMAVGRPLAVLLLNREATVTITHVKTKNLKQKCLNSDIIVAAAGVKHLIKEDYVKDGAIVIDVGINVENGKLYGDVDFDNVKDKCALITPVPGGVGSVTTMILAKETLVAKKISDDK